MEKKHWAFIKDYIMITFGCFLMGFAINYFYISNHLAEGGFAGISLIIHYLSGFPMSILYFIFNLPILFLAWKFLGRVFVFKTIYGTVCVTFAIYIFSYLRTPIPDFLLSSLFGGALVGISSGIIFVSGGSTGGTDVIAKIITRYKGIPIGRAILAMDFVILSLVAFLFGKLIFMYTLIATVVYSKVVDFIIDGLGEAKAIMIITSKPDELRALIDERIGRGVTFLHGEGSFSGKQLKILYCVVSKYQLVTLKRFVRETDPKAFITITTVHEVLGNGFKRLTMND